MGDLRMTESGIGRKPRLDSLLETFPGVTRHRMGRKK